MDANSLRPDIARWRLQAGFSQEELDQEAGFSKGTIGRIERGGRNVTEDEVVRILVALNLNVSVTFISACGGLLRKLLAAEPLVRDRMDRKPFRSSAEDSGQTEFEENMERLLGSMREILLHIGKVSDPERWIKELMLAAAAPEETHGSPPRKKRVRKRS
jgi:transcriptional regulator with XRE-family HTH domain